MVEPITPAQVKKQKVWEEMVTKARPPPPRAPPAHAQDKEQVYVSPPPPAPHAQAKEQVCVSYPAPFLLGHSVAARCGLGRQFTMSVDKVALFDGKAMTTASGNVIAPNLGAGNFIG
jgi:hypothetical protein